MSSSTDILIIGAGVTGLTTALRLAEQGVSVTLIDRQQSGKEASWAGAGMLPPGNLSKAETPEARLRSLSHQLWPTLAAKLKERTGIDNGYRLCGSLELPGHKSFDNDVSSWRAESLRLEDIDRTSIEHHVPGLHPEFQNGVFLQDFGQARNPRHLKALLSACHSLGVEILEGVEQLNLTAKNGHVKAATPARSFAADRICVTAGSWTNQVLQPLGISVPVTPVRGQIVQLKVSQLPFSCVIEQGRRYIVPRADGLILVGSTEEHVGFEKRTTAEGVSGLLQFAERLVPELGEAELVRSWAGLRPGSPDELPYIGRLPQFKNLYIGAGHFRSGLQMSPGTGEVLASVLLDLTPPIQLTGLGTDRLSVQV